MSHVDAIFLPFLSLMCSQASVTRCINSAAVCEGRLAAIFTSSVHNMGSISFYWGPSQCAPHPFHYAVISVSRDVVSASPLYRLSYGLAPSVIKYLL